MTVFNKQGKWFLPPKSCPAKRRDTPDSAGAASVSLQDTSLFAIWAVSEFGLRFAASAKPLALQRNATRTICGD